MASVPTNHAGVSNAEKGKAGSVHIDIDHVVRRTEENFKKVLDSKMDHIPATIFRVPDSISAVDPESYTPQMIGLGPFHHLRPEVSHMQKKKFAAVKRFLHRYPESKNQFIGKKDKDELKDEELRIRACYDILLEFEGNSLVWVTGIDALFLSELLSTQGQSEGKELVQNAILKDVMMLENQIPLFLLKQIAKKIGTSSSLPKNLLSFCKAMSPFHKGGEEEEEEYVKSVYKTCPHLLCLLYILIVPIPKPSPKRKPKPKSKRRTLDEPILKVRSGECSDIITNINEILEIGRVVNAPGLDSLKQPITVILGLLKLPYSKLRTIFASRDTSGGKSPQLVPPASSLATAGVIFKAKTKGLPIFEFDEAKAELHLPVIKLGVNSKFILRNLVAFEALLGSSSTSQPELKTESNYSAYEATAVARTHVLAGCTKLMDGLLENAKDVKILEDAHIIKGKLESDQDVVQLFSGMSVSSELTAEDDTVRKLNNFYNNSPKIKMWRSMNKCGSILCSSLRFIVVMVLLVLMAIQTFCSVYNCHHLTLSGISSNGLRASIAES